MRVLLLATFTFSALLAQDQPKFEAASIRLNNGGDAPMRVMPLAGGSFSAENVTLKILLTVAYHVSDYQISGAPAWIGADRYEVMAKSPKTATVTQTFEMLQSLLVDRFKLRMHRETKEGTVLELSVASGGPKLTPLKEGECIRVDSAAGPPPTRAGEAPPNLCGNFGFGKGQIRASGARIDQLAVVLSRILEHPVVNKTGIGADEMFDIRITHSADESNGGSLTPEGSSNPESLFGAPGIATAVQEQLGLKLRATKGPVDMLVIDNVERPSEN